MNTTLAATYIITVILLIATPGPVVALIVNTASISGPRKAFATAVGTNWSSLALIALASYIIITSAAISNMLLTSLSLLGCLFIGYLAVDTLGNLPRSSSVEVPVQSTQHGGLWRGFMVGISNPKDIIFFISFFPQFMQITSSSATSLILLSSVWIVIDFLILGAYICVTRKILDSTNNRLVSKLSGIALLLVAVIGMAYNVRELLA